MKSIIILIVWFLILIYNVVYSFLPPCLQSNKKIRILAIVAAVIILGYGIFTEIKEYNNRIFAYVSNSGEILESRNFPWKIVKTTDCNKETTYIIEDRCGDSSLVSIKLDKKNNLNKNSEVHNAIDGIRITFFCEDKFISNFKIEIQN